MAIICAASRPLQSEAPRPYTRPSATVAPKGGKFHLASSSTGTTSVWDMNMRPARPVLPSIRAMMFPRSGWAPRTSEGTPSSASQSPTSSQTWVSLPVA